MSKARSLAYLAGAMLLLSGCSFFGSKEVEQKLENEISNLTLDQQLFKTRLSLAEDRIISLQTQINEIHEKVYNGDEKQAEAAVPAGVAPAKVEPVRAAPPVPVKKAEPEAAVPQSGAEASYKNALESFMARRYQQAESLFTDFINKYPKSPFMPNAGYWLGECHYAQKRYAEAIISFQGVVRDYPAHQKAADSLLKTGYSYEKLGDKANARFYLEQVLEIYPAASAASLARYMLAGLV